MPHSGGSGGWGSGAWGYGSWGGGAGAGAIALLGATAYRENVFRFEFSVPVYWSTILDEEDAARPDKWSIAVVEGTSGRDGNEVRPLLVSEVFRPGPDDGVELGDVGRFVDVVTDRPMTPHPALYDVTATDVFASDRLSATSGTVQVAAVFKALEPPRIDQPVPSRDIANAQTLDAARASLPNPADPLVLGTLQVDDSGDYAFDEGVVNLRKRIVRRLMTTRGAFAHLPDYGIGIPTYGKRLAKASVLAAVVAEAEDQIGREPDVAKVHVRSVLTPNEPGFVRFQIFVRPVAGIPQRFDVPFLTE